MTQILNSSIKLNEDQIITTINNLAKCRHLSKVELMFKGKPSFNEKTTKQLDKLGVEYSKITKLVDVYLFRLSKVVENESVRELRKYNTNVKIKNLNERVEFVFVIDADKFDKQHYLSLIALYPLIVNEVETVDSKVNKDVDNDKDVNKAVDKIVDNDKDVNKAVDKIVDNKVDNDKDVNINVSITCSNLITSAISKHFNSAFLPCPYRVFSLCDVYPLIGSKTGMFGFTSDYELIEYEELYNKLDYMIVYDDDPIVKILNAKENDLIVCKNILFETTAYFEYTVRIVKRVLNDSDSLDTSGLVY